ncbi:MAG: FecR domain-containing protein [Deltaproteobacteria bacterium]|nr:FecR domain-containing protein [Deltaproteobacteria bacterium]
MKHVTAVFVLCLLCLFSVGFSSADEVHIGRIRTLDGTVIVLHRGNEVHPFVGTRLFIQDIIKTGHDGSVGIILEDDTIFSLGPDSALAMKEFRFDPLKKDFSLVSRMIRGSFIFISGFIGKLSPKSIKIETPYGTVAVRGTRFAVQIQER